MTESLTPVEQLEVERIRSHATVCVTMNVQAHPNADRLDLVDILLLGDHVNERVTVVTGKHYRKEQLGIYIPAGLTIPGWLAEDSWLFGRATAMRERFDVRVVNLRGIDSPGLFCGQVYRKDGEDPRSVERFTKLEREGGGPSGWGEGWIAWPFWRTWWKLGDDVTAYLGLTGPCCQGDR